MKVYFKNEKEKILMGKLGIKKWKIFFEYSPEFLDTKLELSPLKLPLKPGIHSNNNSVFDGLFGVFNDIFQWVITFREKTSPDKQQV